MLKSGIIFTFFLVACASATLSPPYVHVRQAHLAATSTPDVTSTVVADLIPEAPTLDIVKVKCAECGDDKPDYDYTRAAQKQQHKLRRTHASELPETTKEVEESMFTTPPPNATPAPKVVESPEASAILLFGLEDKTVNKTKKTKLEKEIEERVALMKQAMELIMLSVSEFKPEP